MNFLCFYGVPYYLVSLQEKTRQLNFFGIEKGLKVAIMPTTIIP